MNWDPETNEWRDRKEEKRERKRLSTTDRSQFTKKNQARCNLFQKAEECETGLKKGFVKAVFSQELVVLLPESQKEIICPLRGALKKHTSHRKNLLVVGDWVLVDEEQKVVHHLIPRRSILSRAGAYTRHKEHVLAANLDKIFITVSLAQPKISTGLIDRFIISCIKGNIIPEIVINKSDLIISENLTEELAEIQDAYKLAKVPIHLVCAKSGDGILELKKALCGYTNSFVGPSGTGKSSILSYILEKDLKVGAVVKRTQKGAHTTTKGEAFFIEEKSVVIDTPGVKSFALWDIEKSTLQDYFTEIKAASFGCHFQNCMHSHEPNCHVRQAVDEGKISPIRYQSYLDILENLDTEDLQR